MAKTKIRKATLLQYIKTGDSDALRMWLDTQRKPKYLNELLIETLYQPTPDNDIIELIINAGADVNYETKFCEYPLSVASNRGRFACVRQLLDKGADATFLGWNALMFTLIYGTTYELQHDLE